MKLLPMRNVVAPTLWLFWLEELTPPSLPLPPEFMCRLFGFFFVLFLVTQG